METAVVLLAIAAPVALVLGLSIGATLALRRPQRWRGGLYLPRKICKEIRGGNPRAIDGLRDALDILLKPKGE